MMTYLGGPESPDALVRRHERYLALASSGAGETFTIAFGPDFDTAGTTGYWQRESNKYPQSRISFRSLLIRRRLQSFHTTEILMTRWSQNVDR